MNTEEIKKEYKKIWYEWNSCGQKNCAGCVIDFEYEWEEIEPLFAQSYQKGRNDEREKQENDFKKAMRIKVEQSGIKSKNGKSK